MKVQQVSGLWPREGAMDRQPAILVRLVRWLTDTNFLRKGGSLG